MKGYGASPYGLSHLAGLHKNNQYFPDQSLIYEIFRKERDYSMKYRRKKVILPRLVGFSKLKSHHAITRNCTNTLGVMVLRRQDVIVTFQNGAHWNMQTAHEITEHPRKSI